MLSGGALGGFLAGGRTPNRLAPNTGDARLALARNLAAIGLKNSDHCDTFRLDLAGRIPDSLLKVAVCYCVWLDDPNNLPGSRQNRGVLVRRDPGQQLATLLFFESVREAAGFRSSDPVLIRIPLSGEFVRLAGSGARAGTASREVAPDRFGNLVPLPGSAPAGGSYVNDRTLLVGAGQAIYPESESDQEPESAPGGLQIVEDRPASQGGDPADDASASDNSDDDSSDSADSDGSEDADDSDGSADSDDQADSDDADDADDSDGSDGSGGGDGGPLSGGALGLPAAGAGGLAGGAADSDSDQADSDSCSFSDSGSGSVYSDSDASASASDSSGYASG